MKRKLRRMASFCMTVVLLLSSVVWAPAAGAEGETISLAEADIHIEDVCYYKGSQQTPKMTVTLHTKVLTEGLDYTTTYQNNVDAGNGGSETGNSPRFERESYSWGQCNCYL